MATQVMLPPKTKGRPASSFASGLFLLCLLFFACTAEKKDEQVVFKTYDEVSTPPLRLEVMEYEGSYGAYSEIEVQYQKIEHIRRRTLEILARRIGMVEDSPSRIRISYRDWSPAAGNHCYHIAPLAEDGNRIWHITFIVERLRRGYRIEDSIYKMALAEAILKGFSDAYVELPAWLQEGILYYATDQGSWLEKHTVIQLLSRRDLSRLEVADVVRGILSGEMLFGDLEGYLALQYMEARKKTAVKRFLRGVFNGEGWRRKLHQVTGLDVPAFEEQAKQFAVRRLIEYRPLIMEYRRALGSYAAGQYFEAISQLQRTLFRYEDKFLAGNLTFWIAMAHYRRRKFVDSAEKFAYLLQNYRRFCHYLPLAQYRLAMSHYHLRRLQKAISAFSDFRRDYPEHEFQASARFFLGRCFLERKETVRALDQLEKLIEEYPGHHRYLDALTEAGKLCLEMSKFHRARTFYEKLIQAPKSTKKQRAIAKEGLAQIDTIERRPLPPQMVKALDDMAARYGSGSLAVKKVVLQEMVAIGKIAFPWIKEMLRNSPSSMLPSFIAALKEIGDPTGAPLLLEILDKEPALSKAVLLTLLDIGISPVDLEEMVTHHPMLPEVQKEVRRALDDVFWNVPASILRQYPTIIRQLNEDEAGQLKAIEKLSLEAGKDQVVVLMQLALKGSGRVKVKALEALNLWRDRRAIEVFLELLDEEPRVCILALEGLDNVRHYPLSELAQLLDSPVANVRIKALELLSHAPNPEKWGTIAAALADRNIEVREYARSIFLRGNSREVRFALLEALERERRTASFYSIVIQILEKLTGRSLPYHPQMSFDERRELAARLRLQWQGSDSR